jgi:hypothetical protein
MDDPFARFEADRAAWANGGMQEVLAAIDITMTHDDLVAALGPAVFKTITDAGFVLVPREWRERVFRASKARAESAGTESG